MYKFEICFATEWINGKSFSRRLRRVRRPNWPIGGFKDQQMQAAQCTVGSSHFSLQKCRAGAARSMSRRDENWCKNVAFHISFKWPETRKNCHSFLNQLMQPNWAHALQSFPWLGIKLANSSLLSWTHFSQAVKMSRYCDLTSWVLFVMLCISRSTFRSLIRPVHFVTRPTWVGTAPLKCVWLEIVGPVRSSLRYDASL